MLESFPLPQGAGRDEGRVEWKCPTCHRPSEVAQNARDVASNSTDQKYPHQKHQKFVMEVSASQLSDRENAIKVPVLEMSVCWSCCKNFSSHAA
jgi:hypothetical protein